MNSWHRAANPNRILVFVAAMLLWAGAHAQQIHYGRGIAIGDGVARAFLAIDFDGRPLRIGVTITKLALDSLPDLARSGVLPIPQVVPGIPFDHVVVNWTPDGETPEGRYEVPLFTFHFFAVPEAQHTAIPAENDPIAIEPKFLPRGYTLSARGSQALPGHGVIWIDGEGPEQRNEPLSQTVHYGFYRGELQFIEPLISLEQLAAGDDVTKRIKQPRAYRRPGYYPTTYSVRYDEQQGGYQVALEGFVRHLGTEASKSGEQ